MILIACLVTPNKTPGGRKTAQLLGWKGRPRVEGAHLFTSGFVDSRRLPCHCCPFMSFPDRLFLPLFSTNLLWTSQPTPAPFFSKLLLAALNRKKSSLSEFLSDASVLVIPGLCSNTELFACFPLRWGMWKFISFLALSPRA